MKQQGRVPTKWATEYSLYVLVSHFVDDVIYQYHSEWLGSQSLDIYIPTQKIAIEYQGEQHSEVLPAFGGEASLNDNLERDVRKYELALKNGVSIRYWDFSLPVTKANVLEFLENNNITYLQDRTLRETIISPVEMAPVVAKKKKTPTSLQAISQFIVQYSLDGRFIAKYPTIRAASAASGAGVSSINKVLSGDRNSAGRFVWRRFKQSEILEKISIDFDISKINDGIAK